MGRRRCWRGRRLSPDSEELFEKVARLRRGDGHSTCHRSGSSPFHLPLGIRLGFYIGRRIRARHLSSGSLRFVRAFFVLASEIASRVMISHRFDQLERIGLMRGCKPGDLHIELAFILRQRAFENARGDRARDLATVPRGALHHHYNDVLRMVKWRETSKPRNVFLVATLAGLRGAGLPRHHPIFQTRPATGSSIFVHNFPKAFAHKVNFVR